MEKVAETPLQWPTGNDDERYRRVVLDRSPYLLLDEVRGDVIEFVAIAHTKRVPGYWTGRLRIR